VAFPFSLAGKTETVTRVRPPAKDTFGDPLPGTGSEVDVPGCLFAPGGSTENLDGADQVVADATVYMPDGTDIRPTDRVRARGDLYDVVGKPRVWAGYGVEVPLRLVTG
jgi:hypothetical protein